MQARWESPRVHAALATSLTGTESLTETDFVVVVPEVADYEVRRELILARLELSLARLASVRAAARFEPITSEIMLAAARIWADARAMGRPMAARERLDGDAILLATARSLAASQPRSLAGEGTVMIATTNVRHLAHFANARLWSDIELGS